MTEQSLQGSSSTQIKSNSKGGFPLAAVERIRGAQILNRYAIYAIYVAIAAFIIFGTIASLKAYRDSDMLYRLFYYLPYVLVGLTVPITLYDAFIILRYQLNQPSMVAISIGLALIITVVSLLFSLSGWLWLGIAAWMGAAFLFSANFKRFFKFMDEQASSDTPASSSTHSPNSAN
ncbi:MAG: hypothetical protein Q4P13_12995 [Psychrobacter sp.]|nr:hypothetical protein [Psychrobacter sp.]